MRIPSRPAPLVVPQGDATVAPQIVRELAPWYVERHKPRDDRQAAAVAAIGVAFDAYAPALKQWKAEKEAAKVAAGVTDDDDDDFEYPTSPALGRAALILLESIQGAAAKVGVVTELDAANCRLRFRSGDNLLVRFSASLAKSLGTDAVFAPLELAYRGSRGTFIHSPRTLLLSELGVKNLRPQTTELHESRHAHHFALHREKGQPTILDSRIMPAYGKKRFTTRKEAYVKGFSIDELVTFSLQTVQDRGGLSLALRSRARPALLQRAFVDAAQRAKKHAETRHGGTLAKHVAEESALFADALFHHRLTRVKAEKTPTFALTPELELRLVNRTGEDAHLRIELGNKTLSQHMRLHVRDPKAIEAFMTAAKKNDTAAVQRLVDQHVVPWVTALEHFSSEVAACFSRISKAASALEKAPTADVAECLQKELSRLASQIRSPELSTSRQ